MKRELGAIYAEVRDEFDATGEEYDLKEVQDEVRRRAEEAGLEEELWDHAIRNVARTYDRHAHDEETDGQLTFGDFGYGRVLHTANSRRISTFFAALEHVLADDELFDENWRALLARKDFRDRRTRALSPYLATGVTVPEAIDLWHRDHPEQTD